MGFYGSQKVLRKQWIIYIQILLENKKLNFIERTFISFNQTCINEKLLPKYIQYILKNIKPTFPIISLTMN